MSSGSFSKLRYRQVHLDFHTSEHIGDVGRDFDAARFVETLQFARVDSISVFARCHHGWCYYPSAVGVPHPGLVRPDLLGEMVDACRKANIETPIYITVQWDENLARIRPEWRAMSATNRVPSGRPGDGSANYQMTAGWHSLCLSNPDYRRYLIDMGLEVVERYEPPGLFYDIVTSFECVCPKCIARMQANGLSPESSADRRRNDDETNAVFRREVSAAIWAKFPRMRLFFNSGHIDKYGRGRFQDYSHLELESLPTGQWGYDHFPVSARYAAALGMDFLGQTGKFHTSWGEFGGLKQPQALDYECAQMAAMGAKCLVGDQLHPLGTLDADTYELIRPAYQRIEKLEPYLQGARHRTEIAILTGEYFAHDRKSRNMPGDVGAARMLMELHRLFDVIDPEMDFSPYRLLILPDEVPVDAALKEKLDRYVEEGGKLLLSGRSGIDTDTGRFAVDAGLTWAGEEVAFEPSYLRRNSASGSDGSTVMYGRALKVIADGAEVVASITPSYFNRSWEHFCSHQHSPEDRDAPALGPAITRTAKVGYVAYPIFSMYHYVGQPIYKYLVRELIDALVGAPVAHTNLPSAGRVSVADQPGEDRTVVHLLFGGPQIRGRHAPDSFAPRAMEMIEDIPVLADIHVSLDSAREPVRVYDALDGTTLDHRFADGRITFTIDRLHIHAAIAVEYGSTEG